MVKKLEISQEELKGLYLNKGLSTFKIAGKFGCCQATIWKRLNEFNIRPRLPGVERVRISKERLKDLYFKKRFSTWKIEKILGIPRSTIHRKLKEHGIAARDRAEPHIIYPRKDFSGDLVEKAYLIGFRIGDLRVRKQYPNSKTICAACSSTIPEQIRLIEELFNKYGRIWVKKSKNNRIHSEARLNNSFIFLLSKETPSWVLRNKRFFFPFLSGFIDAEGSIGIYNNQATLQIGNYDHQLLFLIYKKLNQYGIKCNKPLSDNRKGKLNSEGYKYNEDYWYFRIGRKDSLSRLFEEIEPHIKHKKKIKALNNAIENINSRNKIKKYKKMKNFQISTAIDYPSGYPHAGHMYEKICADVLARWNRLLGYKVHFSTGTDCHGLKLQRAAEKAGKTPKDFVNEMSDVFRRLCELFNISYDDFIMTIENRHEKTVVDILKKWEKKGYVYKGKYEGLYCVGCETFYTEKDLVNGECSYHPGKKLEKLKEETYFFKLSAFQKELIKNIEKKNLIWPEKKKKEILTRLKEPLKDLSISRANVSWGIPLPFDKKKTIAVWNDALINYLSTVEYPGKKFKDFWPAVHIIGSDIVWHHTVIWFSMLLALGVELPRVVVHGFINVGGEKLSKSKGLVIDPIVLGEKYGADPLRYFLIRNIPFGEDGDFNEKDLVNRHNNELANNLGNLISRVTALAERNGIEKCENKLLKKLKIKNVEKLIDNYELDKALNEIFAFVDTCNTYTQEKKPWETKDKKVLYELIDSIKVLAILLWPFIPETSEKIANNLNFKIDYKEIKKPYKVQQIKKAEILFKKIENKEKTKLSLKKTSLNKETKEDKKQNKIQGIMKMSEINFSDWEKIDLRVAEIEKAEDIDGADKLYKLSIDVGEVGKRTICAGIKKYYDKKELKGKKIIYFSNLKPRNMRGIESQGMLLAAGSQEEDVCVLISPEKDIKNGSKIS